LNKLTFPQTVIVSNVLALYICSVKREYYVFYCRARSEKKVTKELQSNGFEVFLPTITERRQWSDRIKKVESVLFPSYIFVCCLPHQISTVAGYKHIVRPVKLDGNYAFLSDKDIEVINLFLKTGYTVLVHETNLRLGDKVKVVQGAFKGMEGVLIREKDSTRFAMELDVLDKTISVEIDAALLEKIPVKTK
jgi:transcription antitermination factor NusG